MRKFQRKLHLFVVLKHVFVNYCNKGSQATQVGSHGIEASYITVHSYDILVINTLSSIVNLNDKYIFQTIFCKLKLKLSSGYLSY